MLPLVKPKPLSKGDVIRIISPASPQRDVAFLYAGMSYLQEQGYRCELSKNALQQHNAYLAGTDQQRLDDLHSAFSDPNVQAIFCARGGYGSARLLEMIDYELIRQHPKIFVGFSDVTALQCAFLQQSGLVTFAGPMPSVDMREVFHPFAEKQFWQILMQQSHSYVLPMPNEQPPVPLKEGSAKGRLLPVNLTVAASLAGTPFFPQGDEWILFPEEVGEEPYRIDRSCTQLLLQKSWKQEVKAIVFGQCSAIPEGRSVTPQPTLKTVLQDIIDRAGVPGCMNAPFGHVPLKWTIPFGVQAELTVAKECRLELTESWFQE